MDVAPPRRGAAQRPPLGWYLSEPARGALTFGSLPLAAAWLRCAPRGDGHGVLVLPGLLASDWSTQVLRRFVSGLGYRVLGWGLGRNLGPTASVLDGIPRAVRELARETGAPVSVIGWSLGGIYGREIAREHADVVREVITLGSPFAMVDSRQSRADAVFRRRAHLHADPARVPRREQVSRPIPVPSTAVYSRRDGIVDWHACIADPGPTHENVEVRCGHLGFGVDPATLWLLADRLAQQAHRWQPFQPPRWARFLYPGS